MTDALPAYTVKRPILNAFLHSDIASGPVPVVTRDFGPHDPPLSAQVDGNPPRLDI